MGKFTIGMKETDVGVVDHVSSADLGSLLYNSMIAMHSQSVSSERHACTNEKGTNGVESDRERAALSFCGKPVNPRTFEYRRIGAGLTRSSEPRVVDDGLMVLVRTVREVHAN